MCLNGHLILICWAWVWVGITNLSSQLSDSVCCMWKNEWTSVARMIIHLHEEAQCFHVASNPPPNSSSTRSHLMLRIHMSGSLSLGVHSTASAISLNWLSFMQCTPACGVPGKWPMVVSTGTRTRWGQLISEVVVRRHAEHSRKRVSGNYCYSSWISLHMQ